MPDVDLLPLDPQALRDLRDDPAAFARTRSVELGEHQAVVRDVAEQMATLVERTGATMPWGGYLGVDRATRTVVGTCAFTDAPTDEGTVEIAYFTFPAFERQGYATAMAGALLAIAAAGGARRVIAHTLPEPNASTRVLERLGFHHAGDAHDDDAGPVWRWQRAP